MTKEIIALALEAEGLKAGTQGYAIPDEREASCLVSAPGELLSVSRLVTIELRDKYLALQTTKDERYIFAYEDVLGLRLMAKAQARDRSAGFAR